VTQLTPRRVKMPLSCSNSWRASAAGELQPPSGFAVVASRGSHEQGLACSQQYAHLLSRH